MAKGMSRITQPIAVTPRWCLRIDSLSRALETAVASLLYRGADPAPRGSAGALRIPVEPDTGRLTDQVRLGHATPDPTILAVIAIITHHQILSRRDHPAPHRSVTQQGGRPLPITAVVTADLFAVTPRQRGR